MLVQDVLYFRANVQTSERSGDPFQPIERMPVVRQRVSIEPHPRIPLDTGP